MAQSFNCPNCGAPLDYDGSDLTIRCPFCSSSVIVPDSLRTATPAPATNRPPSPPVVGLDTLIGQADKLREVARLLRAGNKVEAVKVYKEAFDVSLAEAMESVTKLQSGMPVVMPGSTPGTASDQVPSANAQADLEREIQRRVESGKTGEAIHLYRQAYPSVPLVETQKIIEKYQKTGRLDIPDLTVTVQESISVSNPRVVDAQAQARADIAHQVEAGNKIEAIKLYRRATGASLREAKEAVEAFQLGQPLNLTVRPGYSGSVTPTTTTTTQAQTSKMPGCVGWGAFAAFCIIFAVALTFGGVALWPNTLRIAAPFVCPTGYDDAYGLSTNGSLALHCVVDPDRDVAHNTPLIYLPLLGFYLLLGAWIGMALVYARVAGINWGLLILLPLATLLLPLIFWASGVPVRGDMDGFWILFTQRDGTRYIPSASQQWLSQFSSATETLSFGAKGTAPGYFNSARSIAVDKQGTIYVSDYNPGRIQVFDSTGHFVTQWSLGDTYISSIAIAGDNKLYVAQSGDLDWYDSITGQPLGQLKQDNSLNSIALAPDGAIVGITDQNIVWFSSDGQLLRTSDTFQELTGSDISPEHLAIDSTGKIYVSGNTSYQVLIFSPQGKLITKFGSEGDANDQFDFEPNALAVDAQGRVFVHGNFSLHVFDGQGNFLTDSGIGGNAFDLAFTPQNNLLVMDGNRDQVVEYRLNH